jgi:pyruvyltransferase
VSKKTTNLIKKSYLGKRLMTIKAASLVKFIIRKIKWIWGFLLIPQRLTIDYENGRNWGDKLTPTIVESLTGRKCQKAYFINQHRYFVIGSILHRVSENASVWGAGFISKDSAPAGIPRRIHAVRGPYTRKIFLDHGIPCPEVYGDPAILLGILCPRKTSKEFKIGIIPHYIDKNNIWVIDQLKKYNDDAIFIDIEGDINSVINQVCRCEYVISSSLHGLICADAYEIPSVRVVLSDLVTGGDFKFHDYRLGVGSLPHEAIDIRSNRFDIIELTKYSSVANLDVAKKNLLLSCPFDLVAAYQTWGIEN